MQKYEVLLRLLKNKECTLEELQEKTGMSRGTVLNGIDHLSNHYPVYEDTEKHITYFGILK